MTTTNDRYTPVAVALHWLIALLVVGLWIVGATMEDYPDSIKWTAYGLHKATGILVLTLTLVRLAWRATHRPPALPKSLPKWQKTASALTHYGLYALLVLMPLSGWAFSSAAGYPVSVYGLFTLPNLVEKDKELTEFFYETHELLANGLLLFVAVHTVAALVHHYYHKDNVLRRMLPARWSRNR